MGTNYYARIIPKEEDKQKLKKAIDDNQYNDIESMVAELYAPLNMYTHKGGEIHLGKASCGWKFLWNSNIHYYCDGYITKGEFTPIYKHYIPYELTKEGITNFVMRDDVIIYDEYGNTEDKEDFLNYALNKEGIDCKEYYSDPMNKYIFSESSKELEKFTTLGFTPKYGEFYSDGLRFSTSIDFC